MKKFMILILLIISVNIFADDSVIKDYDYDLGEGKDYFFTSKDSLRFSLFGGTSYQFKTTEQLDIDIQILKRLSGSNDGWLALQYKKVQASYDYISDPVESSDIVIDPNSDANFDRDGKIQNISLIGIGYSHRFRFLQEWINSNKIFETTSVYFNYVTSNDETTKRDYTGYGLTADFGVHKRVSKSFFYGTKLSYNIASVTREQIGEESEAERSLVYGWLTIGLEIGYFF